MAFAQDHDRFGKVEFFGTRGRDLSAIRQALPVREGDRVPESDEERSQFLARITGAVRSATGEPPTDISPVCCDENGAWTIYIGLAGASVIKVHYSPALTGGSNLPAEFVQAYDDLSEALAQGVSNGATEDHSQGYALSTDPVLRAKQQAFRERVVRLLPTLYKILETSANESHRAIAAHALGYAPASKRQIAALVRASRDSDDTVRNNAVRALWVLAGSGQAIARRIRADPFIALLKSGKWSDRNKGLLLLSALSDQPNPRLLRRLSQEALPELTEMAHWSNPGHSQPARTLLERIALSKSVKARTKPGYIERTFRTQPERLVHSGRIGENHGKIGIEENHIGSALFYALRDDSNPMIALRVSDGHSRIVGSSASPSQHRRGLPKSYRSLLRPRR